MISLNQEDNYPVNEIIAHQTKLLSACLNSYSYDPSPLLPPDSKYLQLEEELATERVKLCNEYKEILADLDRTASKWR